MTLAICIAIIILRQAETHLNWYAELPFLSFVKNVIDEIRYVIEPEFRGRDGIFAICLKDNTIKAGVVIGNKVAEPATYSKTLVEFYAYFPT